MVQLVSEHDIARAASSGSREFVIPAGSQLTPQAIERARELGITLRGVTPPRNGLGEKDVDPATGLPWGVRAGLKGGPILSTPVEERKPEGYASAPFRTPQGGSGPYKPKLKPSGNPPSAPSNEPFFSPSSGPLPMSGQAPAPTPSVLDRGPHGGGGEWGPPLTSDQANPSSAYRTPAPSTPSVIERGPHGGGGEWGPPLTSDQANPASIYRPPAQPTAGGAPTLAPLPPLNGGTTGAPAPLPPIASQISASQTAAPTPAVLPLVSTPIVQPRNGTNGSYANRRRLDPLCDFDRVRRVLAKYDLDAIVCAVPHNVHYLSGLDKPPLWEFQWHTIAVVPRVGEPALAISQLDLSALAEQDLWIDDLYPFAGSDIIRFDAMSMLESEQIVQELNASLRAKRSGSTMEAVAKALRDRGLEGKRIGFDDTRIVARIPIDGIQPLDALDVMREVRMIKNPAEIDRMRAVAVANEQASLAAAAAIPDLDTWDDVVMRYKAELALLGGNARYFLGGAPHHTATHQHTFRDYPLTKGEFYMVDALGEKGHYIGDFGRTVCWGDPNPKVVQRFNALRRGFEAGLAMVRPGVPFDDIRQRVVETVRREGFGEYSLCVPHSVGMEHTDSPRTPGHVVVENMTMNIDIAYLEASFGSLHLEDTFVVRAHGAELLTSGRTELIVLP